MGDRTEEEMTFGISTKYSCKLAGKCLVFHVLKNICTSMCIFALDKVTSSKTLEQFMKSVLFQFSQSKMAAQSVLEAVDILTVALSTTYTVLQTEYCTVIARRS